MGEFISFIRNWFKVQNDKVLKQQYMATEYAQVGFVLFNILNNCNREFLGKYLDYSELCIAYPGSTWNQYVYSLKLTRPLDQAEERQFSHYLMIEYCRFMKVDPIAFSRNVQFSISGNNLFIRKVGANKRL